MEGVYCQDQRAPEFVQFAAPSVGSVGAVNRPHVWGEYTCHFVIFDESMEVRTRARSS